MKKAHLSHFPNLYTQLTGTYPQYQVEPINIISYPVGLQKAYQVELETFTDFQRGASFSASNPLIHNTFLWAISNEQASAKRLSSLNEDVSFHGRDSGGKPFVVDIEEATKDNHTFRTAIWTGEHLQVTLMSINVGEDIGLELHPDVDQFLRVEQGQGLVKMGDRKDVLDFQAEVSDDFAIMIPAGKWHNLINTGNEPLKLYSIYAPPEHPFGTVHQTKAIAMAAEEAHH